MASAVDARERALPRRGGGSPIAGRPRPAAVQRRTRLRLCRSVVNGRQVRPSSVVGLVHVCCRTLRRPVSRWLPPSCLLPRIAAPARAATCPGADATGGTPSARTAAVLCLTAQARARAHRSALRGASALQRSAALKVDSIERCGTFTHTPCGSRWRAR